MSGTGFQPVVAWEPQVDNDRQAGNQPKPYFSIFA
jgi:hypothetical protein